MEGGGNRNGAEAVVKAIEDGWMMMRKSVHSIVFEIDGRLESVRGFDFVDRLMSSVLEQCAKPQLIPKKEVAWKVVGREEARFDFEEGFPGLCMMEEGVLR